MKITPLFIFFFLPWMTAVQAADERVFSDSSPLSPNAKIKPLENRAPEDLVSLQYTEKLCNFTFPVRISFFEPGLQYGIKGVSSFHVCLKGTTATVILSFRFKEETRIEPSRVTINGKPVRYSSPCTLNIPWSDFPLKTTAWIETGYIDNDVAEVQQSYSQVITLNNRILQAL